MIGGNVDIGPRAIVGNHTRIGDGTTIGAACVIADGVEIGAHCRIDANVTICAGSKLGNRVIVQSGAVLGSDGFGYVRDDETGRYELFPQIGRLVIEDDVEIGANSTVDRGALDETRIRRGTKIDNLVHVGHNVQIGQDVVIAAQTGISGSSVIEDNVIIGGQVGIADHVRIEEGAILGAQSGIPTRKVIRGKGVVFWGTPARPIAEYLRELAFISRAARRSCELRASSCEPSELRRSQRLNSRMNITVIVASIEFGVRSSVAMLPASVARGSKLGARS